MTIRRSNGRIRAVLFDFDGTLADTTELIMRSYRHTMAQFFAECPPDDEWLSGFGTPLELQIARFARSPEEQIAMIAEYRGFQEVHHDALVRPFPGATEAVADLASRGVPMAIVTSKYRRSTLRGMELCGLIDHIPVIVTPEDVTRPKPDAEPVAVALARLDVDAGEAVFVGDSPHDIAAGKAAGSWTAAALWGPFPHATLLATGADYCLERIDQVTELVES